MLCKRCYEVSKEEKYRIMQPQDEEGFGLSSENNKLRQLMVRNGDHLMILFQCELYHFINLKGADPRGEVHIYCYWEQVEEQMLMLSGQGTR